MGRIVVGVDGSRESMAALEWAVEEARLRGAQIETVYVFQNTPSYRLYGSQQPGSARHEERAHARAPAEQGTQKADAHDEVARMVDNLDQPRDVELESLLVEDRHPEHVLVERSEGADLLVVGSHGRGRVPEMLLGSVSHHCATHARCPIVIIRTPRPT